jgi:aminoglycoside/choline kinase family phosphotransferase/dTDP-glucose pyrophosphorylase
MSDAHVRGMILAAGYGTRLVPVTDHVPKPLLPVGERTLLDRIIEAFDSLGVQKIGINTHHLGGMVTDHVAVRDDRDRFTLFPEKEILGTGGALDGARDFLAPTDHFLLHNGDVLCDADLQTLLADHLESGALATMLLVDWPAVNSVTMDPDGRVISIAERPEVGVPTGSRNLTYAGIGVFSRKLLDDIGPGFSSLIDPLVRALENDPESVRGHAPENVSWSDLGTLKRFLAAQPDTPASGQNNGLNLARITGHGSDRQFWRLTVGDWSAVAMVSPPEDEEFGRFLSVADFLGDLDLGSPQILSVSESEHTVLMEDLGPGSLFFLVQGLGFGSEKIRAVYSRSVDRLVGIQNATIRAMTKCPAAVDRQLDYDALRWETDYFRDRFLVGHLGLIPENLGPLEDEFHALADIVASQPQVLIHRDFQSQNILVTDGRIRLVDFQGMRLGPLGYDLASLVFDPYVAMPSQVREELVELFFTGIKTDYSLRDIRAMVQAAGLQRIMQAVGAFGFLGNLKGKHSFLDHIPAGLIVLRELLGDLGKAGNPAPGGVNCWQPGPMPVLEKLLRNFT